MPVAEPRAAAGAPEPAGPGQGPVRVVIRRGLDIAIGGAPLQEIHPGPPIRHVALCGHDFAGLRAALRVEKGDHVSAGQPLFVDKHDPAVRYVSPGSGTVVEVNRGARRVLESVVVRLDDGDPASVAFDDGGLRPIDSLQRAHVVDRLAKSGLWTAFRGRPFSRVPRIADEPAGIFVTAIDTQPLAADARVTIAANQAPFEAGLRVLACLTPGTVWLCTGPQWNFGEPVVPRLRRAEFAGPHPAGLAGTHMHMLGPVGEHRSCWHIGYSDVIAIGRLFAEGLLDFTRVIALGGEPASRPRLLLTRAGAALEELVAGETDAPAACRVVSGSPLSGRVTRGGRGFLGRYHQQVSLLPDGGRQRRFAWRWPGRKRLAAPGDMPVGEPTGMLPVEDFDRLMPRGFLAVPLLRALMAGDVEQARALGCLELDEEDLALCAWACPARCDYGGALRSVLARIEREG